jgi:hypothetical protein
VLAVSIILVRLCSPFSPAKVGVYHRYADFVVRFRAGDGLIPMIKQTEKDQSFQFFDPAWAESH